MQHAFKHLGGGAAVLCLLFLLTHCNPSRRAEWHLLAPEFASLWEAAGISEEGTVQIQHGEISLPPGQPMTGARFAAWDAADLPRTRYIIEYQAMRVAGNDFFGTMTFPVEDAHLSLVVGGWGGTLVGISCLDDMDANENTTRGNAHFENHRWYQVRIEVRSDVLRVWIDRRLFVNVSLKGRTLGLRAGDIEKCVPFGFASYATQARVREVVVRRLH